MTITEIAMPLRFPFETSHGAVRNRRTLLVRVETTEGTGTAECVALPDPGYSDETVDTSWNALNTVLVPRLLDQRLETPADALRELEDVPGHRMAKASLECALWDAGARSDGKPLWKAIGGVPREVPGGVVVGFQPSIDELLVRVRRAVEEGYKRVKLKVRPGWDIEPLKAVRRAFPDLDLAADANGAYLSAEAFPRQELDILELSYIEQPLDPADLPGHVRLQERLETPICLDESIKSPKDCRQALEMGAARVINIKIGRLGGIGPAKEIHDIALAYDVPVWCGGMLETGVGRAFNIALATLPNFRLPSDLASSSRYFERDVVLEPPEAKDGAFRPPARSGSGVSVDWDYVRAMTIRERTLRAGRI